MKKAKYYLAAAMMTLASIPVMGVSAETVSYTIGDVDMDGIVTGHDTAMVSRYVLDSKYTLTEEQLQLADVNEDGIVDQADADILYNEMQEYALGDVDMNRQSEKGLCTEKIPSVDDAIQLLEYYARRSANLPSDWSQVQMNLADVNLDGKLDITDACTALMIYARGSAALEPFGNSKQYYYFEEPSIFVLDPDNQESMDKYFSGNVSEDVIIPKDIMDMCGRNN